MIDAYFKLKLLEAENKEARELVLEAYALRHNHPNLSGPELLRLAYWGAAGTN
jgi:hypothetical protein